MPPAVSVVMPVHNGARYVTESLESLRRQSFTDFEIVVVDDGSSDDTPRILAEFATSEPRCRIITQPNQGQAVARDLGVKEAKAPLIAWLDADDIAEETRLARQVAFLGAHPHVAAVGSAIRLIDGEGRVTGLAPYPCGSAEVATAMSTECALAHSAVTMRKAAFMKVGGYRQAFLHAEDYDLWLRLLDEHAVDNLKEPLVRYRQHGGSVSFRYRRQQSLAALAAKHCMRARRAGRPDPYAGRTKLMDESLFADLSIPPQEEALFRFECLASCLTGPLTASMDAWIVENLGRTWELRGLLPRGRYVHRCLCPYVRMRWRDGNKAEALRWLARALTRAPLACLSRLLSPLFRKTSP